MLMQSILAIVFIKAMERLSKNRNMNEQTGSCCYGNWPPRPYFYQWGFPLCFVCDCVQQGLGLKNESETFLEAE